MLFTKLRSLVPPGLTGLTALAALALAAPSRAVELQVVVTNSVAPGLSTTSISGDPGRPWRLYLAANETPFDLSRVIHLNIAPVRQLAAGYVIEGVLDATGHASFTFTTSAGLAGRRLSFQAISPRPNLQISNLCRARYMALDTIEPSAGPNAIAFAQGDLFPLADGRMLAIGGAGPVVSEWLPDRQEFQLNGVLSSTSTFSARAQLADGRVLVCGGLDLTTGQPSAEAWLYDPARGVASPVGPMSVARAGAAACRLPNGRIFVFGGLSTLSITTPAKLFDGILASSELFDPATSTFLPGPSIAERKAFATATLLNNNQVLVAGGLGVAPVINVPFVSNLAWLYNATSNTFGLLPKTFTEGRMLHAATKLSDGRVLLSGGITADLSGILTTGDPTQIAFTTIASTTVYSTTGLGSFSNGPTMLESRAFHTASALDATRAFVAGGFSGTLDIGAILSGNPVLPSAIATTELVTPSATLAGPLMAAPRAGASALRSPLDGRPVIVGGGPLEVELYQP